VNKYFFCSFLGAIIKKMRSNNGDRIAIEDDKKIYTAVVSYWKYLKSAK